MTVFTLRQATIDDAAEIVRLHTAVHEEAYGALLPDEFFGMRRATLEQRIEQRRISLAEGSHPLLAQDGDGTLTPTCLPVERTLRAHVFEKIGAKCPLNGGGLAVPVTRPLPGRR